MSEENPTIIAPNAMGREPAPVAPEHHSRLEGLGKLFAKLLKPKRQAFADGPKAGDPATPTGTSVSHDTPTATPTPRTETPTEFEKITGVKNEQPGALGVAVAQEIAERHERDEAAKAVGGTTNDGETEAPIGPSSLGVADARGTARTPEEQRLMDEAEKDRVHDAIDAAQEKRLSTPLDGPAPEK